MIAYDDVLAELHAEADRIQTAITALTALANRQDSGPPVTVLVNRAAPVTPKLTRKTRKAPALRVVKGSDWKAQATALAAEGEPVAAIAKAVGQKYQTVYSYLRTAKAPKAGKRKAKGEAAPSRFRCQDCGQTGTDPVRCDHCQEKRAA